MLIAQTLQNILENPFMIACLDRAHPVKDLVDPVLDMWGADLVHRNPAPAYFTSPDGAQIYQGTDLDLFSVLLTLSQRRAVVNLPSYAHLRKSSLRSNQSVISRENRHGQIIRPVSNLKTHAFSVLVRDFNIVETKRGKERVGALRNFNLVQDSGDFYDGWNSLEWFSTPEEDQFIEEHDLETFKDTLEFTHFVHPNLAFSFYGSPYLITKTLALRLADQAAHYSQQAQELRKQGIRLRAPLRDEEDIVVYWREGETQPVKVRNLEARLILPEFQNSYPIRGVKEDGHTTQVYKEMPRSKRDKRDVLRYAKWISRKLTFRYGPLVRASSRAVELAFFKYGFKNEIELKPGWDVPDWVRDYQEPRKRIKWNMLELNPHVKLLYRIRETTARVKV